MKKTLLLVSLLAAGCGSKNSNDSASAVPAPQSTVENPFSSSDPADLETAEETAEEALASDENSEEESEAVARSGHESPVIAQERPTEPAQEQTLPAIQEEDLQDVVAVSHSPLANQADLLSKSLIQSKEKIGNGTMSFDLCYGIVRATHKVNALISGTDFSGAKNPTVAQKDFLASFVTDHGKAVESQEKAIDDLAIQCKGLFIFEGEARKKIKTELHESVDKQIRLLDQMKDGARFGVFAVKKPGQPGKPLLGFSAIDSLVSNLSILVKYVEILQPVLTRAEPPSDKSVQAMADFMESLAEMISVNGLPAFSDAPFKEEIGADNAAEIKVKKAEIRSLLEQIDSIPKNSISEVQQIGEMLTRLKKSTEELRLYL